ncbi:phosphonate C-P lyase system protein PhnL [Verminephrobacter aporrectodeae subsp. tuberculatae]|uniref:phosphonate C-P lyase system protein PhnL n=1 Tax=Verminephrobacter aporrectodeae TaxID=1110389 RepID=UPI0022389453|nr:phosphonate C-P lyase system protein PhnL [Verminephrobacter aporrectodeae]MCW5221799.1 phosphonate C-P lyase system protein PhnL [Verminephrobacter aporrectodeae subsp. tuberculatae]MCW5291090.1 phosphonate C-P lyase system protein PhnL [Verminephrobacter aporrectodeae subsp. tuberculatae]MCW8163697.1 phosphonate C-P lyase system protein PhnL [Verminephrobacter aporrectodeae subsp. tuberculatae]MCW8168433.1 phosphonate C-P lyase system protein PhnL [Verminephrobacter aporrectodeae subsp. tu
MTAPILQMKGVSKRFTLHHQNGVELPVLCGVDLSVAPGECVVLDGPSGMGKSTLLKLIYANYRASEGSITVRSAQGTPIDVTQAAPRTLVQLRRDSIGYVSQFLRVIPRVPALDVVAEPLTEETAGDAQAQAAARAQARAWLSRLRIPERLWQLPPATFSGGEQQRVNIARNMIRPRPLLLLDEPTASLDAANTETVIALIREAVARGAALVGIFHDAHVGAAVATRRVNVGDFRGPAR